MIRVYGLFVLTESHPLVLDPLNENQAQGPFRCLLLLREVEL